MAEVAYSFLRDWSLILAIVSLISTVLIYLIVLSIEAYSGFQALGQAIATLFTFGRYADEEVNAGLVTANRFLQDCSSYHFWCCLLPCYA
jgi:hypothetical protein